MSYDLRLNLRRVRRLPPLRAGRVADDHRGAACRPPFFRFADDAEFSALRAGAGLADVRIQTLSFDHVFDGHDDL